MGALHLHAQLLQAQPLGVADDADGRDHRVEGLLLRLAAGFDMGGHAVLAPLQLRDDSLFQDGHALFLEGLLRQRADLGVLHGQDAVEHLDHRRLRAHGVVEAGELDADGARADDQQLPGHALGVQCVFVGPDEIAVGLHARQFARPRAGRQNDGAALQLLRAALAFHLHHAPRRQGRAAHEDAHVVLLHQMADAGVELARHGSRALDDGIEIEGEIAGLQTEL